MMHREHRADFASLGRIFGIELFGTTRHPMRIGGVAFGEKSHPVLQFVFQS